MTFSMTAKAAATLLFGPVLGAMLASPATAASAPAPQIRLYTLDCGKATISDMGFFSDTGEYDGKAGKIADPCFVIRHPKGVLLWDTGLGDKFAAHPEGVDGGRGMRLQVKTTLLNQLKAIGLSPSDISFVAFSHFHFDHTGNANEFPKSVWIINKKELAAALAAPPQSGIEPSTFSGYKTAKTQMIDADYDVFGDGTVRILKAPGHTAGHQVLEIKLSKTGVVILSGDLYHLSANRQFRRVPSINENRADTLASMDRIDRIVARTHGRLIVQHDAEVFETLPKPPAFLD
jgi:N-acyl homoserine lactone hydrolase